LFDSNKCGIIFSNEGKLEDAQKMLAKGLQEELIIEITGLQLEQIKKLKESLAKEIQ
jgi:hypothetical protein